MKYNWLLAFFVLFSMNVIAQTSHTGDYVLKAGNGKVESKNNLYFWKIPVTLTNQSNQPLRYFSLACSWTSFFALSDPDLQIVQQMCDKNEPKIVTLAAGKSTTVVLSIVIEKPADARNKSIKIGFNLLDAGNATNPYDLKLDDVYSHKNLIWSNMINP
jgi:hypothetical protein